MHIAAYLIGLSWLIFFAVWIVMAIGVKRAAPSDAGARRWIGRALALLGLLLIVTSLRGGGGPPWLHSPLAPASVARANAAVVVTYVGLAIAIWARFYLGRNWSAHPEVKQDHELVTSGPYRMLRHPIYSGLLLMFVGVVLLWATPGALLLLLVVATAIHLKLSQEEQLMAGEFPDAWPAYCTRTKRLIPLVW